MYSKTVMLGRVAIAPELRTTPDGVSNARFRIAVERSYVSKTGNKFVDFFDVVAWRGLGDFAAKYFPKGKPILVDGHMENRSYEDKDGKKRSCTELIAETIKFAGDAPPQGSANTQGKPADRPPVNIDVAADPGEFCDLPDDSGDLPFKEEEKKPCKKKR